MNGPPDLSLAEWVVLALVAESPTHGFAVASVTAEGGEIGQVWHVPRPIVYRAVTQLTDDGLLRVEGIERGVRGPQRSVLAATPAGSAAVLGWLTEPVRHVRDVRSALLVKLALLERRGHDSHALLMAQRALFAPMEQALRRRQLDAVGFERVVATWRTESLRAVLHFLNEVDAQRSQQRADG